MERIALGSQASQLLTRRAMLKLAGTVGAAVMGGALLSACASGGGEAVSYSEASASTGDAPEGTASAPQLGDKTLIAVFSWSGNTLNMANRINELADADFFRIETAEPYPDDVDATIERARTEQDADFIPELAARVDNWDDYHTVFLGYPIWWYELPQAVKGFIQSYDWAGKTIIPFSSHEGSSFSGTPADIQALCPNSSMLQGISIQGEAVASSLDSINVWYDGLALA